MTPEPVSLTLSDPRFIACHDDAHVYYVDNVVSPVECRYIIDLAKGKLQRASVSIDEKGSTSGGRTGSNCWLPYSDDATVKSIGQRIAERVGLPLENAESFQVIHYDREQEYRPLFDAYDLSTPRGQRCCRRGGQRLLIALVYLNEVEAGGATAFPRLGIDVKPRPGRMLVFRNTAADSSKPHPLSLHAGTPVTAGEKWAFNMWFHAEAVKTIIDFDNYISPQILGRTPINYPVTENS